MTIERITDDMDPDLTRGHRFRYHLAGGFCSVGDTVLDAACGTAYGLALLPPEIDYWGVDIYPHKSPLVFQCDLVSFDSWIYGHDVFIGFETIEHLSDYTNYVKLAKQARKWIIVSVPVVPTKHENEHHLHDFVPGQLRRLFEDQTWEHFQTVWQPEEYSEICVFRNRFGT